MLGYYEEQVLELSKNTLPTIVLLFVLEVVKSARRVMAKEILDNKQTGQS